MQQITNGGAFTYDTRDIINRNFALSTILTQGNAYWVKPVTGNDGADGLSPQTAFKTVLHAYNTCRSGYNDVVLLCAEGQTSASTTDYQSATLTWAKNLCHLIGVNDGPTWSSRSRIALISTYATASNLMTVSGSACLIANIQLYQGVASALPTGCLTVSGQRNKFANCHIAGMGNAANDIAAAYSLNIDAGAENLFEDCTIGQDTTTLGATINSVLYFATGATRNYFRRCLFPLYTAHATNTQFVRAAAGSMDRSQYFEDCVFDNAIDSGSTALTQAMTVAASGSPAGGIRLLGRTAVFGATDWNATDAGNVRAGGYTPTNSSYGLGVVITR